MTPTGLHVGALIAGSLAVIGGAIALHFLRVRRRRVVVDSLLFFRGSAETVRPRVLGNRLARYLSLALTMLAGLLAWFVFAEARSDDTATSRIVIVDLGQSERASVGEHNLGHALLDEAEALVAREGLGPRGRLHTIGTLTNVGLRADEPALVLAERAQAALAIDASASVTSAILTARGGLRENDEIVVFGGPDPLPEWIDGVRVRKGRVPSSTTTTVAASPLRTLRVRIETELPSSLDLALDSIGAVRSEDGGADLLITASTTSAALLPTLVLVDGASRGEGELIATAGCRAPLSLRDRHTDDVSGFAIEARERPWITDARGAIAYAAESRTDSNLPRVRIATGLLEDRAHRDTPLLLHAALAHLAPSAFPVPTPPAAPSPYEPGANGKTLPGDDLAWLLLATVLALIALDAWLFARGKSA